MEEELRRYLRIGLDLTREEAMHRDRETGQSGKAPAEGLPDRAAGAQPSRGARRGSVFPVRLSDEERAVLERCAVELTKRTGRRWTLGEVLRDEAVRSARYFLEAVDGAAGITPEGAPVPSTPAAAESVRHEYERDREREIADRMQGK